MQALNIERRLPDATGMGAVTLKVNDLDKMIDFYHRGLGMQVLAHDKGTAVLGRRGAATILLDQDGTLAAAPAGAAGLYHTAFLFPTAAELASVVYSAARHFAAQFQGSSDHLVSEAFYFGDPEGNGVELYVDRPRETWLELPTGGGVQMTSDFLDPNRYLQQHLTDAGAVEIADTPATVGHVHLKVGDIASAKAFYVDALGFDVTNEYGSQALFVSAGGYHHHLGMNTWESKGAADRTPALGLGEVLIELPGDGTAGGSSEALGALDARLAAAGIERAFDGAELTVLDPWRNRVRVRSLASAA